MINVQREYDMKQTGHTGNTCGRNKGQWKGGILDKK